MRSEYLHNISGCTFGFFMINGNTFVKFFYVGLLKLYVHYNFKCTASEARKIMKLNFHFVQKVRWKFTIFFWNSLLFTGCTLRRFGRTQTDMWMYENSYSILRLEAIFVPVTSEHSHITRSGKSKENTNSKKCPKIEP